MSFDRYSLYAANFGGILLRDLFDHSYRLGTKKSVVIPGGDVHPRSIVSVCGDPTIRCSTKDFAACFAGSPALTLSAGHPVNTSAPLSTPAALLQFQARADGGTFYSSAQNFHLVGTNQKGFLHVSEITARQDDERGAAITLEYFAHSTDGVTDPLSVNRSAALSSSPNFGGIWYLGPVVMGPLGSSVVRLPGVQSVSFRTGIDYRAPRGDGNTFSRNGSIHAMVPELRIETLDLDATVQMLTSPHGHLITPTTGWHVHFVRGRPGGFRESDASAVHYILSVANGDFATEEVTITGTDDGRGVIVVRPTGGVTLGVNQAVEIP